MEEKKYFCFIPTYISYNIRKEYEYWDRVAAELSIVPLKLNSKDEELELVLSDLEMTGLKVVFRGEDFYMFSDKEGNFLIKYTITMIMEYRSKFKSQRNK